MKKLFKTSLLLALLTTPAQATTILIDSPFIAAPMVRTGAGETIDVQVLWTDLQLHFVSPFLGGPSVFVSNDFRNVGTADEIFAPLGVVPFESFYSGASTVLSEVVTINIPNDVLRLFSFGWTDSHQMTFGKTQLVLTYEDGMFETPRNAVIVTPLPAALPLFAAGFGIVAFLARRRRAQ